MSSSSRATHVALYSYNDILIRKDMPGLALDAIDINGPYAAYLSVDGWTPSTSPEEPPRVIVYGASPHISSSPQPASLSAVAAPPEPPSRSPSDTSSAEAYRLSEGEAP